ncbi:MAG: phospho-N-acetylmuramoyl-pentapeptide-transferase [Clostridia bacterium]
MSNFTVIILILLSFFVCMFCAPLFLKLLKKLNAKQSILGYVETHKDKEGTPTIGGVIFLVPTLLLALIFCGFKQKFGIIACFTMVSFGLLGFLDDYIKIKSHHNEGLKAYQKFIGQIGIGLIISFFCYKNAFIGSEIYLPFSDKVINLGGWYVPFCLFIFLATTNAVNLTDGLDGLAGGVSGVFLFVMIVILTIFTIEAQQLGDVLLAKELDSLLKFTGIFIGGILAFLWLNSYPAKVFMGDTGSLAIGGAVACICVFCKQPFIVLIVGIMYVVSCISVIVQVAFFKITHKRVFKMAPLHHHLELCGYKETKIVAFYIIITILAGLVGILSL